MPWSRKETESVDFDCPRLGDTALVQLTYLSMDLGDGQQVRTLSGGGCENAKECGVGTQSANGLSWSFDWTKCVYPQLKPKH